MVKYIISAACFVIKFFITFFLCFTFLRQMVFDINFMKSRYWILSMVYTSSCTTSETDSNQLYPNIRNLKMDLYIDHIILVSFTSELLCLAKLYIWKEKQIWVIVLDAIRMESMNFKADWEMYVWNREKCGLPHN